MEEAVALSMIGAKDVTNDFVRVRSADKQKFRCEAIHGRFLENGCVSLGFNVCCCKFLL